MTAQTIYTGNCVDVMKNFAEESFDMILTSPPYDDLRSYNGFSFGFEDTARQMFRVLKQGGTMVWVVGDAMVKGSETGTSFQQALDFIQIGFKLNDTMIFLKQNVPPLYPTSPRYTQKFEYMFVFTKGKPKTYNPLKDKKNKHAGVVPNIGMRQKDGSIRKRIAQTKPVKEYGLRDNVWEYHTGGGNKTGHPATFPLQLAKDHILSWSNEYDLILDPFMGSGTTLLAAKQLNRNALGIDISEEYCEIARKRLEQDTLL